MKIFKYLFKIMILIVLMIFIYSIFNINPVYGKIYRDVQSKKGTLRLSGYNCNDKIIDVFEESLPENDWRYPHEFRECQLAWYAQKYPSQFINDTRAFDLVSKMNDVIADGEPDDDAPNTKYTRMNALNFYKNAGCFAHRSGTNGSSWDRIYTNDVGRCL